MLKVQELRVGNYISHGAAMGYVNPVKIETGSDIDYYCKEGSPILLTPEILEKCGFRYIVESELFKYWEHWNHKEAYVDVTLSQELCPGYYDDEYKSIAEVGISCQYLHQLQNLYLDLTGTELEIKL